MNIWLTTDTHFGHKRLIERGRPEDFEARIWRGLKLVSASDILIHLGDVSLGNDREHHERLVNEVTAKRKWLIKGNHDDRSNAWYMDRGWDMVCDQLTYTFEGKRIVFSHCPTAWDGAYDWNFHGHFHDSDHRRLEPEFVAIAHPRQKLLALEYTDYKPVLLQHAIKEASAAERTTPEETP